MKKILKILVIFLLVVPINLVSAETMAGKLSGRILLQVEKNGEAWYVSPRNLKRYFLGRPEDAFQIMRNLGIGITNSDLEKISVGAGGLNGPDTDQDGLVDNLEDALGLDPNTSDTDQDGYSDKEELENDYNPDGSGELPIDDDFSKKQSGKISLQVEESGEAWYINPRDLKRYFLGRPEDAFSIMRSLGLGITNDNLEKIIISEDSMLPPVEVINNPIECQEENRITSDKRYNLGEMEKEIHELVNQERKENGLDELKWNCEIAEVARKHSENLASENMNFTSIYKVCDFPMIHHEGTEFGLYQGERLNNLDIYYFNRSGENIALMQGLEARYFDNPGGVIANLINNCKDRLENFNSDFSANLDSASQENKIQIIEDEIEKRIEEFTNEQNIQILETEWSSQEELNQDIVEGWMGSPGHRENILTKEYDEAGIGITYINSYVIATQVFITRTECGYENGPCCIQEGYYPACFVDLECENSVCQP